MGTITHFPTKTTGVFAPSRERFQSIAALLKEPCVWLAEPAADDPAPAVDTFIIDSDLLAADPMRVRKWHEHYRSPTPPVRVDKYAPAGLPPSLNPKRIIIYQCPEHLDADNPLQNT